MSFFRRLSRRSARDPTDTTAVAEPPPATPNTTTVATVPSTSTSTSENRKQEAAFSNGPASTNSNSEIQNQSEAVGPVPPSPLTMPPEDDKIWLDAHHDQHAGLRLLPASNNIVDYELQGQHLLAIADTGADLSGLLHMNPAEPQPIEQLQTEIIPRIRFFKGTKPSSSISLVEPCLALHTLFIEMIQANPIQTENNDNIERQASAEPGSSKSNGITKQPSKSASNSTSSSSSATMQFLAVTTESALLLYNSTTLEYRYSLPPDKLDPLEISAWQQAITEDTDDSAARLVQTLQSLRDRSAQLGVSSTPPVQVPSATKSDESEESELKSEHKFSSVSHEHETIVVQPRIIPTAPALSLRSKQLLCIKNSKMQRVFVSQHRESPLVQKSSISCITVLFKRLQEERAPMFLIMGTEANMLYIVDPNKFKLHERYELPSAACILHARGSYYVQYKIVVVCRDRNIFSFSGKKCSHLTQLESHAIGITILGKYLYVGCVDGTLSCFDAKGHKQFTIHHASSLVAMQSMEVPSRNFKGVLIALENKEMRLYSERTLISTITLEDIPSCMYFGNFDREENSLVICYRGGGMGVKILRRKAVFLEVEADAEVTTHGKEALSIPKKSRLFVDQMLRERENAAGIHQAFQKDVMKMRVTAAKASLMASNLALSPSRTDSYGKIKMDVELLGMGPFFVLRTNITNFANEPLFNMFVTFLYNRMHYTLRDSIIRVPLLLPGIRQSNDMRVECVSDGDTSGTIAVMLSECSRHIPVSVVHLKMPVSCTLVFPNES